MLLTSTLLLSLTTLTTLSLASPNINIPKLKRNYKSQPPYPISTGTGYYPTGTGTGTVIYPTNTGTGTGTAVYPPSTGTGTSPPKSKPTYDGFEVLHFPCSPFVNGEILPPYGTLTCCNTAGDGPGAFGGCIPPFKIADNNYDACPISPESVQTSGFCCAQVNPDGTATGCKTATAIYDISYPPYPPGPPPPEQGIGAKKAKMVKGKAKAKA